MLDQVYCSASVADTEAVGAALADKLVSEGIPYAFIALRGDLGVGKTAFVRGFCRQLGIDSVHSPTYTVVNEYAEGKHPVFHFDMYRITDEAGLYSIGFEEYLSRDGYALCEWSENIDPFLPPDTVFVTISKTDGGTGREIRIEWDRK